MVRSLPASVGGTRDVGLTPGSGRSPGGGHNSPLHYSCLENPMDRGAWWATVHRVAKSPILLKQLRTPHMHWEGMCQTPVVTRAEVCHGLDSFSVAAITSYCKISDLTQTSYL